MKKNRYRRFPQRQKNERSHFFGDKDPQTAEPSTAPAFFQPKLEIDPVDSPAEKEADSVAKQVVNTPHSTSTSAGVQAKKVQRQGMEEEPAAKRIQKQEEEQAATKRIQKQTEEEPAAKRIQKQEEEQPAAKRIQKKEEAAQGGKGVESMIQQTKGGGSPLPEGVRMEMEQQFGADFSRVRIHTGADAIEMTKALQAHAFTHGYDIYFNEGRFDPESKGGIELLAHELVHVVQQKGSGA